jgi:hypothetical protein
MVSITLTKVWLNRLDTGEAISAQSAKGGRTQEFTNETTIRRYASGRMRPIGVKGETGTLTYPLVDVSLATKEMLREWARDMVAVQVRDARSQKWFGVFAGVSVVESPEPGFYDVTITVNTMTHVEGV